MRSALAGGAFLDLVRKSGLLQEKQLADFLEARSGAYRDDPRQLANEMIREGLLTRFQAIQLLAGKSRGFIINDKYKILEHLGAGGMGSVFLCFHTSMHRRVAIKVLPLDKARDPSSLERFYREARAVAALDHPNIVRAHDIDHDDRFHFLVMEYVEGSSLQQIVSRSGVLDATRAAHYIAQAALGLQHAHEAGLVHRDIKPGNILVDRNGVVKVLDLGLARFFRNDDGLSRKYDETVLGTTDYLAPEQTLDSNVDIRADIYSLGATFYFCLTGQTLFGEGMAAQKLIWHQTRQPKPIRSFCPEVEEELAALVEKKMLAKNPVKRFQTPIEVFEALGPWIQTPIEPPPEEEMPRLCLAARGSSSDIQGTASGASLRSPSPSRPNWSISGFAHRVSLPDAKNPAAQTLQVPTPAPLTRARSRGRSQKSGVRSQGSGIRKQGASATPDSCPLTPERSKPWLLIGAVALLLAGLAIGGLAFLWSLAGPGVFAGAGIRGRAAETASAAEAPVIHSGGVSFQASNGGYRVRAPGYEATVAADGCLSSLRVEGQELLYIGGRISRGVYFYQNGGQGALQLPTIDRPGGQVITARSALASIRYEFDADTISWSATNTSSGPLSLFMVFNTSVVAVQGPREWSKTPVAKDWTRTTWFGGSAKLAVAGGNRIWGPWEKSTQVWEASLKDGESRRVVLRPSPASADERALVAALRSGAAPAAVEQSDFTILAPLNYQVFQRRTRLRGAVEVRGQVKKPCDKVQVRLLGKSLEGAPLAGSWQTLPVNHERSFHSTLEAPAGGWYRLELQALREQGGHDPMVVARAAVDHVGVGEVFVIAGQSNSTNCSQEKLTQQSGMVSSFSGSDWRLANDPQLGVHDGSGGGSCWPAFGDALHERYKVPIGVASTGHAGTSVKQWQSGGELFAWMTGRMKQLGRHGFRAVLWHQGESDVSMATDEYVRLMTALIRDSKKSAGWEFPWFVAQVSYQNAYTRSVAGVRNAQKRLWESGVALEGPDTDTLGDDNRDNGGQGIHFSAKGNTAHGKMWAARVSARLDKDLAREGK